MTLSTTTSTAPVGPVTAPDLPAGLYWCLRPLLSRMSGDWCGGYPQLVCKKVTGSCACGMPLYSQVRRGRIVVAARLPAPRPVRVGPQWRFPARNCAPGLSQDCDRNHFPCAVVQAVSLAS